jgi:hypothetical protein
MQQYGTTTLATDDGCCTFSAIPWSRTAIMGNLAFPPAAPVGALAILQANQTQRQGDFRPWYRFYVQKGSEGQNVLVGQGPVMCEEATSATYGCSLSYHDGREFICSDVSQLNCYKKRCVCYGSACAWQDLGETECAPY